MENVSPLGPRLDLAKLAQTSRDPTRMLISPPPEEELRIQRTPKAGSQPKRKRASQQPHQLTPNPKPRKQVRNESSPTRSPAKLVLHQSPYANNPNADYLLPAPAQGSRRRSATPVIVPYEPPKDVFTPPTEVIITPVASTPRRKTRTKPKPIAIKAEPPVIDLSEPMPPPSPTDDPLLLVGSSSFEHSLPPSTPPHVTSDDCWNSMDMEQHDVEWPQANVTNNVEWSDSDDDELIGESEFTGRWRMRSVPTKQDPPSSATRSRMDSWGRPISPHPFKRRVSTVVEEETRILSDDEEEERQVRAMSVDLDERDTEVPVAAYDDEDEGLAPEPVAESTSTTVDIRAIDDMPVDSMAETSIEHESTSELHENLTPVAPLPVVEEDDEAEEAEVRAMSLEREYAPRAHLHAEYLQTPRLDVSPMRSTSLVDIDVNMEDDSDEEDSIDLGVVKISSNDPRAAAAVTAILKQYNYDCLKAKLREGKKRRKTVDGGIDKRNSFVTPVRHRSRSIGGAIGEKVYFPGSPGITLDNLLEQAEVEVTSAKKRPTFTKADLGGMWSKEEWRTLDMCFTEERYDLAGEGDTLANIDDVNVSNVVARFEELVPYGEWSREDLERRIDAIANKQRGGKVAPPLTPRSNNTVRLFNATSETPLESRNRRASMEVPDFTPLGRRAMPPARSKKAPAPSFRLPEPSSQGVPFQNMKTPSVLLAPRYSHLLDEAFAIAGDKQKPAAAEPQQDEQKADEEDESDESVDQSLETSLDESVENSFDDRQEDTVVQVSETPAPQPRRPPPRTSLGNRMKGFLFSYLPSSTKTAPVNKKAPPRPNQLPLPPIDLLQKPRGPISTPTKAPGPKAKAPKEQVDLQHIEQPKPKSMIPRKVPPKRLVDLNHISPDKGKQKEDYRPRRSSGARVKDMIKDFETMQKSQSKAPEVKRTKSVGDLKCRNAAAGRPIWR